MDSHRNFAKSTVVTPPSPASSGTTVVVTAGQGALFPTPPFNATVWPTGQAPTASNAEIVRVTGISTDTLTIQRSQESSSARSIVVGDNIANTITAKVLTDIETGDSLAPYGLAASPPSSGPNQGLVVFTDQGLQQWQGASLESVGPQQDDYDNLQSEITALGSPISPSTPNAIVAANSGGTAWVGSGLLADANVSTSAAIQARKLGGTQTVNTNSTLVASSAWVVLTDTTGGTLTTITLPSAPNTGDRFLFVDSTDQWATHTLTIALNGKNLNASSVNPVLYRASGTFEIQYNGTEWHTTVHPVITDKVISVIGGLNLRRDLGLLATNGDPANAAGAPTETTQIVQTPKLWIPETITVSNFVISNQNGGSGLTAGVATATVSGTQTTPSNGSSFTLTTSSVGGSGSVYPASGVVSITVGGTAYGLAYSAWSNTSMTVIAGAYPSNQSLTTALTITGVSNGMALFNGSGTIIGVSGDFTTSANWTGGGNKIIPLYPAATTITGGQYVYIGWMATGTTPTKPATFGTSNTAYNASGTGVLTGANARWSAVSGAQTIMPSSITPSSLVATNNNSIWVGLA